MENQRETYSPSLPTDAILDEDKLELVRWIKSELDDISFAISSIESQYEVKHTPPIRYFVGLIAYADGTDWDPGSGEGLYIYKSGGWTFIA